MVECGEDRNPLMSNMQRIVIIPKELNMD